MKKLCAIENLVKILFKILVMDKKYERDAKIVVKHIERCNISNDQIFKRYWNVLNLKIVQSWLSSFLRKLGA